MTAEELVAQAVARGLEAEALVKEGRSRRLWLRAERPEATLSHERGWAVRAGNAGGSFFACGVGEPRGLEPWPEPRPGVLRLPEPQPQPPYRPPADLEAPLVGEIEGFALLTAVAEVLARELPKAQLREGCLEDGQSVSRLHNSRGVVASWRQRAAHLRLVATAPGGRCGDVEAVMHLADRDARRFSPQALAGRLADILVARRDGQQPTLDRADVLVAPAVAARLVAGLLPVFEGSRGEALVAGLRDRSGRIASPLLTIVDDGRLPGGVMEAPVDGEGTPTGRLVLVENGAYLQPILAWWEPRGSRQRTRGCVRRDSFRDLPAPAASHFFVEPEPSCSVGSLLASVARGYYLLEADGPATFDFETGRFSLSVCGFALESGRARGPIAGGQLSGSITALLNGVRGVARDLAFLPLAGMIGSPSLLVSGVELRPGPR